MVLESHLIDWHGESVGGQRLRRTRRDVALARGYLECPSP